MTEAYFADTTEDPRKRKTDFDVTTLNVDETSGVLFEFTERVETLTNQVGELSLEVHDRPTTYNAQLRDLGDPAYGLIEPLMILIEEYPSDNIIMALYPEIEVYGEGETVSEAIQSLKNSILDLYEDLVGTSPDELGVLPTTWLRILRAVIKVA